MTGSTNKTCCVFICCVKSLQNIIVYHSCENFKLSRAAVAQRLASASDRKAAGSNPSSELSWAACWSVLEQDSEPQIAPDVRLAPCTAASAISEGPAMSRRLVQGVLCPRPETAGIGSSKNPPRPHTRCKAVIDNGWMAEQSFKLPGDECDSLSTDSGAVPGQMRTFFSCTGHILLKFFFSDEWEEKCPKYAFMCIWMLKFAW